MEHNHPPTNGSCDDASETESTGIIEHRKNTLHAETRSLTSVESSKRHSKSTSQPGTASGSSPCNQLTDENWFSSSIYEHMKKMTIYKNFWKKKVQQNQKKFQKLQLNQFKWKNPLRQIMLQFIRNKRLILHLSPFRSNQS
ncbi:uncharacterized protein LOC107045963 isoform X2 [Diachasma alloeum]|uniref:uncharacterized protein LOC107045963 isoform X2 n=1 Tax=Diachasma alloeum TaxID=454923 RepID=UPI0007383CFE|nr:uncharacterized protein LOC107045963 isoform X2 [Diachasma alloeum]